MRKRPTLKTIGQMAGLSHVAVSKALRDAPDISGATKARVRKIAEEVGYTPNIAARNLYLQRTNSIGMVVPAMEINTAYNRIFNEISAKAAALDFCVLLGSSHRSLQLEERHCRMMVGNQVGALIVAACTSETSHIKAACGATPVIFIGGRTDVEEYVISNDYRYSAELAVEHLTGLGHQRIALLTYGPENRTVLQKEAGFREAMARRGLTPQFFRTGDVADALGAGAESVEHLICEGTLPTALWCASDYMAVGAIQALKRHGLEVPGDVSVIGHDDLYHCLYPNFSMTTIRLPLAEIGKAAVELAVSLIEHTGQAVQPHQSFRPVMMLRESTGPVRRT